MPLHRQIYEGIQRAILGGQLRSDTRLPSTRVLAKELGLSRNTVSRAFEQLVGEGYLTPRVGSGTRVNNDLPKDMPQGEQPDLLPGPDKERVHAGRLSAHGIAVAESIEALPEAAAYFLYGAQPRSFCPALPALDAFPFKLWEKTILASWRSLSVADLGYHSPLGYGPLRDVIADHLRTSRGVRCEADQVLITTGTQQALALITRTLLDEGDVVWVENPSFHGIHALLHSSLARVVPVSVDSEGLVVEEGIQKAASAKLVYVSPSHQYPLGVTMSVSRRLKLLQWAQDSGAWIVEDDYDSEFRYTGYPLQALQGLDTAGQVIYTGTFSKSMFPGLRLGFIVAPRSLLEILQVAHAYTDRSINFLSQVALNNFIRLGHFARHIRRMRSLYARRQRMLETMINTNLDGLLDAESHQAGLHMVGWLPNGVDDQAISAALRAEGIDAPALSSLAIEPLHRGGLVLGHSTTEAEMVQACSRMGRVLRETIGA